MSPTSPNVAKCRKMTPNDANLCQTTAAQGGQFALINQHNALAFPHQLVKNELLLPLPKMDPYLTEITSDELLGATQISSATLTSY